jgi:hypothetical protein
LSAAEAAVDDAKPDRLLARISHGMGHGMGASGRPMRETFFVVENELANNEWSGPMLTQCGRRPCVVGGRGASVG